MWHALIAGSSRLLGRTADTAMSEPLDAKVMRPLRSAIEFRRPAIASVLAATLPGKVSLLTAPAGFGKCSLLLEALEMMESGGDASPVLWIDLDDCDGRDDALRYLGCALDKALPCEDQWHHGDVPDLSELTARLQSMPGSPIIAVNDRAFHRAYGGFFEEFVDGMPPSVRMLIASGADLHDVAADRTHARFAAQDLCFGIGEIAIMLHAVAPASWIPWIGELTVNVQRGTGGWPIVVTYLLAQLKGSAAFDTLASLDRPQGVISEYLADAVFPRFSDSVVRFCRCIALLGPLSLDECEAICGFSPDPEEIAAVSNSDVLFAEMHRGRFGLRPLYAHALKHDAIMDDNGASMRTQQYAAGYFSQHGEFDRSVALALDCRDYDLAAFGIAHLFLRDSPSSYLPPYEHAAQLLALIAGEAEYRGTSLDQARLLIEENPAVRLSEMDFIEFCTAYFEQHRTTTIRSLARRRPMLGAGDAPPQGEDAPGLLAALSSSELAVLKLIVEGRDNDEIAEILVLSVHTVRTHLKNIYRKLGVHSRSDCVFAVLASADDSLAR